MDDTTQPLDEFDDERDEEFADEPEGEFDEDVELDDEFADDGEVVPAIAIDEDELLAHSGYVVVVGKPNVGKSTLMNRILGEKIAIVSPKPQTTRLSQLGIYNREGVQAIFVDTPGIHEPRHRLGQFMVEVATMALQDADVILFVVDLSMPPNDEDRRVAEVLRAARGDQAAVPVVIALNKLDVTKPEYVLPNSETHRALVPDADWATLSAATGAGVDDLLRRVLDKLPSGPAFYPKDQLSDTAVRDIVAELVREKVLLNVEQEVPHAVAVEIEEFTERSPKLTYIRVSIYVERDSQKAILIGRGGAMLKRIGSDARAEIEQFLGTQVFLEPWVKVLKNWRRDEALLKRLGYRLRK